MKSYTKDHEWIDVDGDSATIGISSHAQEELGDITFVELPEVGRTVAKGEAFAVVESVKAASDVYAPVAGEVIAVNEAIDSRPELVNEAAEGEGWFIKLRLAGPLDSEEMMDAAAYQDFVKSLA